MHFERNGQSHDLAIRVVPITEGHIASIWSCSNGVRSRLGLGIPPDGISEPAASELQLGKRPGTGRIPRISTPHHGAARGRRWRNSARRTKKFNPPMRRCRAPNEELRTAKEELQSSNEELITVNDELHNRNDQLASANSDLNNVLNAVNIPIIMVGMDFGSGATRPRRSAS